MWTKPTSADVHRSGLQACMLRKQIEADQHILTIVLEASTKRPSASHTFAKEQPSAGSEPCRLGVAGVRACVLYRFRDPGLVYLNPSNSRGRDASRVSELRKLHES